MIAKGNQRAGGYQLATHLLNAHDNERVELLEVRGAIANDLHGAFTEWHAQSKATNCTKYLYSLSVNPDQRQGHLTREQYLDFLDRVEKRLGLERQGRAVVFHWKKDRSGEAREHCHAVWSRIDGIAGRAVNIAHDRMKLRTVAQEFALEHARRLPPGMQENRGPARHKDRASHSNLQEKQQEERSGIAKEDRRAVLTQAWQQTSDAASFAQRMKEAGYLLAQGDKRAYVVIDRAGDVHSLSRQLGNVKAKDLKARLASVFPIDQLPNVEQTRAVMTAQREKLRAMARQKVEGPPPEERRAQLAARQETRRQALAEQRSQMAERHVAERKVLEGLGQTVSFNKAARRGVSLLVRHIANRYQRHQQTRALDRRQRHERHELGRQERKLKSLDARERRSLEIRIGREEFQRLAKEIKQRDARLEKSGLVRAPDKPQQRTELPVMTPADRRSRLQAAFSTEKPTVPAHLSRHERAELLSGAARTAFDKAVTPVAAETDRATAEADRQRELERLRQLEALRLER